ncbi:MAG: DinB family protein [Bacteroidota bacterium]
MKSNILIKELIELTHKNKAELLPLRNMTDQALNFKPDPESWSILECVEHLNRYGRYYIPEITNRIEQSTHSKADDFKSSWLGEYFAKSMLPKEKLNKMKTFKSMNPINSALDRAVLDELIGQQDQLETLLEQAREKNLTKIKTSISISNWIKLRLGDTFRVVIYHNWRHVVQIKNVLKSIPHGTNVYPGTL